MRWDFLGEGGQHVVFAYTGTEERFRSTVLRLAKVDRDVERGTASLRRIFQRVCAGEDCVAQGTPMQLTVEEAMQLMEKAASKRTDKRKAKFQGNEFASFHAVSADLLPNLALPRTMKEPLCVEIKPKWGFLPIPNRNTSVSKLSFCRFCRHQSWKLFHNILQQRSHYCPLDLFSMKPERRAKAVDALIACPRNNLKLFYQGSPVSLSDAPIERTALSRLIQKLLSSSKVQHLLTCIQVLQMLDVHDISMIHHDYDTLSTTERESINAYMCSPEFESQLMQRLDVEQRFEFHCGAPRKPLDTTLLYAQQSRMQRIGEHLMSITAKDVSIMTTVDLASEEDAIEVGVVDLDLKPHSKMSHWYHLDHTIDAHCEKSGLFIDQKEPR